MVGVSVACQHSPVDEAVCERCELLDELTSTCDLTELNKVPHTHSQSRPSQNNDIAFGCGMKT